MKDEKFSARITINNIHVYVKPFSHLVVPHEVEVCMGMGIPREFHVNGNSFWATNRNGNNVMELEWHVCEKVLFCIATCNDR